MCRRKGGLEDYKHLLVLRRNCLTWAFRAGESRRGLHIGPSADTSHKPGGSGGRGKASCRDCHLCRVSNVSCSFTSLTRAVLVHPCALSEFVSVLLHSLVPVPPSPVPPQPQGDRPGRCLQQSGSKVPGQGDKRKTACLSGASVRDRASKCESLTASEATEQ